MLMPGRTLSTEDYRFGFNGKENLNDVKGLGEVQDFGARIYDSRIARWYSIEPLAIKYPMFSPYNFSGNNPILFVDLDGKDWFVNSKTGLIIFIKNATEIKQDFFDKIKYGANSKDFERLGPNDMFGQKVNDAYGNNLLNKDFIYVENSEQFANRNGYTKSEKVKIAESEQTSSGRMGPDENISLINSSLEQIDESKITYVKPDKLNTKEFISKEEATYKYSSFKKTIYNLTKPFGQDNRVTAEYYSNKVQLDVGKSATFVDKSIDVIKSIFKKKK